MDIIIFIAENGLDWQFVAILLVFYIVLEIVGEIIAEFAARPIFLWFRKRILKQRKSTKVPFLVIKTEKKDG